MTTGLREGLEQVAAEAPLTLEGAALWQRGRRRHWRRRASGVAAVAVLAVAFAGGLTSVIGSREIAPASTNSQAMALPDVLRMPGKWEPSFAGPPGPLAAVVVAARATTWWGSSSPALAGITVTGQSRFLDLPGASSDGSALRDCVPALSADGRQIAYFAGGPKAAAISVYDTVTGQVQRRPIPSDQQVRCQGIAWSGQSVWWGAIALSATSTTDEGSGQQLPLTSWNTVTGTVHRPTRLGASLAASISQAGHAPNGFVVSLGRQIRVVTGGSVSARFALDRNVQAQPAISPDGRSVAAVFQSDPSTFDGKPHRLLVGEIGSPTVHMRTVGDVLTSGVLGWRDNSHVVVLAQRAGEVWAVSVDVDTAASTPLARIWGNVPVVADDAWTAARTTAPAAPFAPGPLVIGTGSCLVFGLLAGGVMWWRRPRARR